MGRPVPSSIPTPKLEANTKQDGVETKPNTASTEKNVQAGPRDLGDDVPIHANVSRIPVKSVTLATQLYQTDTAASPAYNSFANALIQRIDTRDSNNATLTPVIRSMLTRDITSLQYLLSYIRNSNNSWIDTATFLRLLLYIFPAQPDAFWLDKIDAQFVRNMKSRDSHLGDSPTLRWVKFNNPTVDGVKTVQINIMMASLTAFVDITRGMDPLLNGNEANHIFTTHGLDVTWTAIPITATLLNSSVIREYILSVCPTNIWAGRSSHTWTSTHIGVDDHSKEYTTYFTSMPVAHNVVIPGVTNIMLVVVEDGQYAMAKNYYIEGIGNIKLYPGARKDERITDVMPYIQDITDTILSLTANTSNYIKSATRSVELLRILEGTISQDGAMRMAVSLASELCSIANKTPYLVVRNDNNSYDSLLSGGWGMGAGTLPGTQYTVRDIWRSGNKDNLPKISNAMDGFNFAAVTPCGRVASGSSLISADNVVDLAKKYQATVTYWKQYQPQYAFDQYRVHMASSIFRVLIGCSLTIAEDMQYEIHNTHGVQNTLCTNAIALSLTLSRTFVFNDIGWRQWYGYDSDKIVAASFSMDSFLTDISFNNFIPTSTPTIFRVLKVSTVFREYYNSSWTDYTWGHSFPIPCFSVEAWNYYYEVSIPSQFPAAYEFISPTQRKLLLILTGKLKTGQFLASSTLNSIDHAPITFERLAGVSLEVHNLDIEQWSYITCMGWNGTNKTAYFTSNVMLLSERYHYLDMDNHSMIRVQNDKLLSYNTDPEKNPQTSMYVSRALRYPDPSDFLSRKTANISAVKKTLTGQRADGAEEVTPKVSSQLTAPVTPPSLAQPIITTASEEVVQSSQPENTLPKSRQKPDLMLESLSDADMATSQAGHQ
nr:MAG: hypothetical protein 1 [Picornavirales sp.]